MNNKFSILLLSAFLVVVSTGCEKDVFGCIDPNSENFNPDANVSDNSCVYARDEFIGTYNVNENCSSGNYTYSITVTESSAGDDQIIINNFGDYGENVRATVTDNSISFNDTQGGISFSGTGNKNGGTLTIIYTASAGGVSDDCTKTCIKQ